MAQIGLPFSDGRVPVFSASIDIGEIGFYRGRSAAGFSGFSVDDKDLYLVTTLSGMALIMSAIGRGDIDVDCGKMIGLWTFVKQGSAIALVPACSVEWEPA